MSRARLAELEARVFAAPFDEGLRQVVADALLEAGDPRGEFISLQLLAARGAATAAEVSRLVELEQAHGASWSAIPGADQVEYARGFPWLVRTRVLQPAAAWNTVGVLVLHAVREGGVEQFFSTAACLASLERVTNLNARQLTGVARWQTPRLRAVDLEHQLLPQQVDELLALPGLEELSFNVASPDEVDWLWKTALGRRLKHVRLRTPFTEAPVSLARLRAAAPCVVHVESWLGFSLVVAPGLPLTLELRDAAQLPGLARVLAPTVRANVPAVFEALRVVDARGPVTGAALELLHAPPRPVVAQPGRKPAGRRRR